MKRISLCILGVLACLSLNASMKWGWDLSIESYDFEYDGIYYGIISESRAEVHVMNPVTSVLYDPYPNWEASYMPEYRDRYTFEGEVHYLWPAGYYKGDIEIPSTVEHNGKEYTVVRIAYGAFAWCKELTSIKLPPTLREIRYGAFSMCTALTEIDIPAGIRVCGGAFAGCSSLKKLDFSECEFRYNEPEADVVVCLCKSLEEIYLPESWQDEPYACFIRDDIDYNGTVYERHERLGYYYIDYDDCPYKLCTEDNYPYAANKESSQCSYPQSQDAGRKISKSGDVEDLINQDGRFLELFGNTGLKKIHATSAVPMTLYGEWERSGNFDPWDFLYDDCVLYVPAGSLEAYSSTYPWSNFKTIVEEQTTSVDLIASDTDKALPKRIYDLSGNLRATTTDGVLPDLAPGFYIERSGAASRKIMVK